MQTHKCRVPPKPQPLKAPVAVSCVQDPGEAAALRGSLPSHTSVFRRYCLRWMGVSCKPANRIRLIVFQSELFYTDFNKSPGPYFKFFAPSASAEGP
jgi:hypothetical protein